MNAATGSGIDRSSIEAIYPLSPVQESLLFATLRSGSADPGFLQLRCTLEGVLDESRFSDAWARVVQRHAALRASVHWQEVDKRLMVVFREVALPWSAHDWRSLPRAGQEERLQTYLRLDRERGFDLRRAPVLRLALFRMADREWHLVWSCHHVLLDGWSGAVVLAEVLAVHDALCGEAETSLPRAPTCRDYIAWLQRQDTAAAEAFWRAALSGWSAPTPLPYERPSDAVTPAQHASVSLDVTKTTTSALRRFARDHRLTLNTVLEGAWAILLSRHAGADDVLFGATTSGRAADVPGIDSMVGLLINTLPVRVQVSGELCIVPFLQRLQDQHSGLRRFEHTPPSQIQAWSGIPGSQRLFESLVVFENFPADERAGAAAGRLRMSELQGGITTGYPLTLVAAPHERLGLSLHYDNARFAAADASRIVAQLGEILEQMSSDADARLADFTRAAGQTPALPDNGAGQEWAVLSRTMRPRPAPVLPRTPLELQLTRIWEAVLGVQPLGVRDDFFEIGGHSLTAAQLFAEIERTFDRRLPLATLFEAPTVELLARRFEDEGWVPPWSPLVAMQPLGTYPPLFCVHSYEGTVLAYRELARRLAPDQPVYGLQAIGLSGREPPLDRVQDMADHYLRAIRTIQPHGPYFLLGLCFGISVALELAHRLHAAGEAVGELIILDSGFWTHVPRHRRGRRTPGALARHLVYELGRRWRHGVGRHLASEETKREILLETAMERAWYQYRAMPFAGPITLIRSSEYAASPAKNWHLESWTELAGGTMRTCVIPGRHTDLLREPCVGELAAQVRACAVVAARRTSSAAS